MDAETPTEIDETDFLQDDMVCSVCYAEFLDKEDLEVHIRQIHLNNVNKTRFCQLCTLIFSDIEEYALHMRNTHLGSLKCCKYCTRLFKSTAEVQEHEKRHNAAVLYPKVSCSHCKNVFDNKNETKNHELKEHSDSDEGLLLRDCLSILSSLLCMNVHNFFNALSSSLPYVCIKCEETTADVEKYIEHLVDNNCHSVACDECCNVFAYKSRLRYHLKLNSHSKMGAPDFKIQCSKCKLTFKAAKLKSHAKTCTGMSCAVCDLSFKTVDEYSKHRLDKHSAKMPVLQVCIYCQRQLFGKECMKKHVDRVHGHEKHLYKYHCTDCNRIFKHPKLLFAHFFSKHKNLNPYTCRICNKKFRVRKGFTLHIKLTHKSEGFVKFDENFHVYFTDKKSKAHKKAIVNTDQNGEDVIECKEAIVNTDQNGEDVIEGKEAIVNTDQNGEDVIEGKEAIVNTDQNGEDVIEGKEAIVNTDQNGEDVIEDKEAIVNADGVRNEVSVEDKHNTNTEAAKNDYTDDHMLEHSKHEFELEIEFNPKDVNITESNDKKSKTTGVQVGSDGENVDCENKNDGLLVERRSGRKRKLNIVKKHTEQSSQDVDISSDDSDIPLGIVSKKLKSQKMIKKVRKSNKLFKHNTKSKKFICDKCDRNCYTYQNYHRHRALHIKKETKVCIKCYGKFDSVKKLDEHIKKEHSSSKLTETLKKLLEKRKIAETKAKEAKKLKEIAKSKEIAEPKEITNSDEINQEAMSLSKTEKFRNTIKKFKTERNINTKVTMKLVDKDHISVKKYIENFMQDKNEVKIVMIKNPITLDTRVKKPKPLIKLTKFTPEPIRESQEVNLKMPVKFTDNLNEKVDVSIKLVSEHKPPAMKFYHETSTSLHVIDETYVNSYDDFVTYDTSEEIVENKEAIPEVAEEVVMEGTETQSSIVHNLKNLPKCHNVQIAHLAPEAPYFKISKINLENESSFTLTPEKDKGAIVQSDTPKGLTLPSGKTLVTANPYEHLLNKNTIEKLKNSKKKGTYKPRISNAAEAIKTALEKLEQTPNLKAKKK